MAKTLGKPDRTGTSLMECENVDTSRTAPSSWARAIRAGANVFGLAFVLFLNGALPFLQIPTLGQDAWTLGFAQSLANQNMASLRADNFGLPTPAPMAFGLAGAWLTGVFIHFGVPAEGAYTMMVAVYLGLAYIGCHAFARAIGTNRVVALLAAVAWTTHPIVREHASYSMLSLGIALMPLYLLNSLALFRALDDADGDRPRMPLAVCSALYLVVAVLAVFMDGYTFVMFFVIASLVGAFQILSGRVAVWLGVFRFGLHGLAFLIAYLLYILYIGDRSFSPSSMEHFRGWGADISFFFIPTQDNLLLPSLMGWGEARTSLRYFGDSSTWRTTFALPVIIGGIAGFFLSRRSGMRAAFAVASLVGFYLSLGPSIKFYSVKPDGWEGGPGMPAEFAYWPTGSAWLSENLPGFSSMRASYRWTVLGLLGSWALILLSAAKPCRVRIGWVGACFLVAIIATNVPTARSVQARFWDLDAFVTRERTLLADFEEAVAAGERIAFLPWRNDFLVNYIAARSQIYTFNVGGDKNVEIARAHWPPPLKNLSMGQLDGAVFGSALELLAGGDVDAVVFPYVDMLWAAHWWPYPAEFRPELMEIEQALEGTGMVVVERFNHFSTIRLAPGVAAMEASALRAMVDRLVREHRLSTLRHRLSSLPRVSLGSTLDFARGGNGAAYLVDNWSQPEDWGVWSLGARSDVFLPLETELDDETWAELFFRAYASGPRDCPSVAIAVNSKPAFEDKLCGGHPGGERRSVTVDIPRGSTEEVGGVLIEFITPDAKSPAENGESPDTRRLGVGLISVRLASGVVEASENHLTLQEGSPTRLPLKGDSTLDFAEGKDGTAYLADGWSHPEGWGVWSLGSRSSVFLPLKQETGADIAVELHLRVYATGPEDCPSVAIHANSERVFEEALCGGRAGGEWRSVIVDVPRESTEEVGGMLIEFFTPDAKSPAENGESRDTRPLGVGLTSIRIFEAL